MIRESETAFNQRLRPRFDYVVEEPWRSSLLSKSRLEKSGDKIRRTETLKSKSFTFNNKMRKNMRKIIVIQYILH